jgi:hypothetical protein
MKTNGKQVGDGMQMPILGGTKSTIPAGLQLSRPVSDFPIYFEKMPDLARISFRLLQAAHLFCNNSIGN